MPTTDREPTQTVRQCADQYGVTDRTVWRWVAKGAVKVARTPGGRVRIVVDAPRDTTYRDTA